MLAFFLKKEKEILPIKRETVATLDFKYGDKSAKCILHRTSFKKGSVVKKARHETWRQWGIPKMGLFKSKYRVILAGLTFWSTRQPPSDYHKRAMRIGETEQQIAFSHSHIRSRTTLSPSRADASNRMQHSLKPTRQFPFLPFFFFFFFFSFFVIAFAWRWDVRWTSVSRCIVLSGLFLTRACRELEACKVGQDQ
jgi:hypothetical protein